MQPPTTDSMVGLEQVARLAGLLRLRSGGHIVNGMRSSRSRRASESRYDRIAARMTELSGECQACHVAER